MPTFEILLIAALAVVAAIGSLGLFLALRGEGSSAALDALERGDFEQALTLADGDDRDVATLAAASAARHLLRWPLAEDRLRRILADDPHHGEAMIELGLVTLYRGDFAAADAQLARSAGERADLLESITLHRAAAAVLAGDRERARELFEEVEAPLETKLRLDVGEGEPAFAEWFLHAALVWDALGQTAKGRWAWQAARAAAPQSRLPDFLTRTFGVGPSIEEPAPPGAGP